MICIVFSAVFLSNNLLFVAVELDGGENCALDLVPLVSISWFYLWIRSPSVNTQLLALLQSDFGNLVLVGVVSEVNALAVFLWLRFRVFS